MAIEVIERIEECERLKEDWDAIVKADAAGIDGMGVSATYDWAMALWRNHLAGAPQKIIVLRDGGRVVGILPCYRGATKMLGFTRGEVAPLTELYSGRCGFLVKEGSADYLETLLRFLHAEVDGWDRFCFTLVDGSASDRAFREVQRRAGYPIEEWRRNVSPFIALPESWETYVAGLDGKFRQNIKRRERKLNALGELDLTVFQTKEAVGPLFDKISKIEMASWKEESGTSITAERYQESFYKLFSVAAAENGWLFGAVLSLDGAPIAHLYGLIFQKIFYGHKTSYVDAYSSLAPGNILMWKLLPLLYAEGTEVYDFQGECEPYKMKWTSSTYSRTSYVMYRNTLKIRLELTVRKVKRAIGRVVDHT